MKRISYLQRFDDVELAVRRHGQGVPLVWGHSLLGSMWVDDEAGLWEWEELEQHCLLARYDARGHGNSDGSYNPRDYRWGHLAGDMWRVAESVAPQQGRVVLGGASMGCCTALEAALQAPERVAGLILVLPPTAWCTRPRQALRYRHRAWMSAAFGAAPYRLLDYLPAGRQRRNAQLRLSSTIARGLATANPLHVQAALRGAAMSDLPARSQLRQLDIPALILTWRGDAAHPVSTARILARTLPRVDEMVVADPWDISEWTAIAARFLEKLEHPLDGCKAG